LASVLGEAIEAAGQVLLDLLVASAARWWSLACADLQCCPSEGKPRAVGCSLAAAEATVAGLVAYADRDEVAGQIAPLSDRERHRFEPDLADAEHRVTKALLDYGLERLRRADKTALFTELRRRSGDAAPPRRLTSKKLARFAVAMTDIGLRDEVWLAIDEHSIQARDFLHELLTRLPPPYDAAPLFLFGWDQWRRGNGTLAAMAAERALESDSHYSAARLLLTAVRHGLDPRTTAPLREQT